MELRPHLRPSWWVAPQRPWDGIGMSINSSGSVFLQHLCSTPMVWSNKTRRTPNWMMGHQRKSPSLCPSPSMARSTKPSMYVSQDPTTSMRTFHFPIPTFCSAPLHPFATHLVPFLTHPSVLVWLVGLRRRPLIEEATFRDGAMVPSSMVMEIQRQDHIWIPAPCYHGQGVDGAPKEVATTLGLT